MSANTKQSPVTKAVVWMLAVIVITTSIWYFLEAKDTWKRGEAIEKALRPVADSDDLEKALAATAILDNYHETRDNAKRWSGVYWGFTFTAAIFSALAALILKLESSILRTDASKKDIAAALSVAAALLITISTSGDFQRKWQANRTAAAEFERIGYEFLEKNGANARSYLGRVGQISEKRHLAILGMSESTQSNNKSSNTTELEQ